MRFLTVILVGAILCVSGCQSALAQGTGDGMGGGVGPGMGDGVGSGMGGVDAAVPAEDELTVLVRVHLLESDSVPELKSSFTDDEIRARFSAINEVWTQADILFEVESIQRIAATGESAYAQLIAGRERQRGPVLGRVFGNVELLTDGWNLALVEDVGSMPPGVYSCQTGTLISARRFRRQEVPINVWAHELGHSLSLRHLCDHGSNLMCADGRRPTALIPDQIAAARTQVETGGPFRCE